MRRAVPLLALLTLAGCGGHGGGSSASKTSAGRGKGTAVLSVRWPARADARLIPNAANSIVVKLTLGTTVLSKTLARPADGSASSSTTLAGLKYGAYVVAVNAYPTTNGAGTAQATGAGTMSVTEDAPGALAVAMDSTVASLAILGSPSTVPNGTTPLALSARDASNAIVLLANGGGAEAVAWSVDAPGVALVEGTGPSVTLRGKSIGSANVTATVRVGDDGTTKQATRAFSVTATEDYGLAVGGYPRAHGDMGGSGQGGGTGARGLIAWTATVGSAPVSSLVVSSEGTAFAACGAQVTALDAGGTAIWTASAPGGVAGLALTANRRLYATSGSTLLALDAATGVELWRTALTGNCYEPNVAPDGTIVQATTSTVYALNPQDRSVRWQVAFAGLFAAVVAADGTVVVQSGTEVRFLDGATGATRFSATKKADVGPASAPSTPGSPGASIPYVRSSGFETASVAVGNKVAFMETTEEGNYVYTSSSSGIHSYSYWNFIGGARFNVWKGTTAGVGSVGTSYPLTRAYVRHVRRMSQAPSGNLLLSQVEANPVVDSYTAPEGNPWNVATTLSQGAAIGPDNVAYFSLHHASSDGSASVVQAVDTANGQVLWTVGMPGAVDGRVPAIGPDGTVYAGTTDGRVVAIR